MVVWRKTNNKTKFNLYAKRFYHTADYAGYRSIMPPLPDSAYKTIRKQPAEKLLVLGGLAPGILWPAAIILLRVLKT
jgi:hypothetical protein